MATFKTCTFQGSTVVLDGNEYDKCSFIKCKIVITRGNFSLHDSTFNGCNFEFGGEAANIRNIVLGLINQDKNKPQAKEV